LCFQILKRTQKLPQKKIATMKRVERADENPWQYGESVLVCVSGREGYHDWERVWVDALIVGEDVDAEGECLVKIPNLWQLQRIHRDRIQKKDITRRPSHAVEHRNILVLMDNMEKFAWWEATIHCINEWSGKTTLTVEWVGDHAFHAQSEVVPLEWCIVARHYTPPGGEKGKN
jgi:hypothetical protein